MRLRHSLGDVAHVRHSNPIFHPKFESLAIARLFFYLYGRANLFANGHINKKIAVVGFQTLEVPPRRAVGMGVKRSKLKVCAVANPIFSCRNHIKQKREELSFFSSVPPQGLDCATCSRQSCARLVYTLPTSLEGRRIQGSRSLRVHKKREELSFFSSVPPQGLEPWTPTLRVSCSTN